MINGLNILADEIVKVKTGWGWDPFVIIPLVILFIGILLFIIGMESNDSFLPWGFVVILVGVICSILVLSNAKTYYKHQYYCIIEDDINFSDFNNNYQIVKQMENNFYIIEPKDQEYFEQRGE